ncbi:MAG: hypothetical protein QGF99_00945 [Acidimicrobiales bacterium]|nr:hypothetical protein [Acidimicrobiales bacterium]MDP6900538.1 hypothetical protein [Acidimicrobiales bacterium]HJL98669.1 hypothetical protein [Acidimicrobiales bacterium]
MNDRESDPKLTAPLEAISPPESLPTQSDDLSSDLESRRQLNLNDPRRILPTRPHKRSSLWRKLVAVLGLSAFSVLGGLVITLVIGLLAIVAALILQAAIS